MPFIIHTLTWHITGEHVYDTRLVFNLIAYDVYGIRYCILRMSDPMKYLTKIDQQTKWRNYAKCNYVYSRMQYVTGQYVNNKLISPWTKWSPIQPFLPRVYVPSDTTEHWSSLWHWRKQQRSIIRIILKMDATSKPYCLISMVRWFVQTSADRWDILTFTDLTQVFIDNITFMKCRTTFCAILQ